MLSTNDQREAKGRTNEFSNFPADRTDARVNQVNVSPLFASTSSPFLFRFSSCAHHGLNLRIWMYCLLLSRCTLIAKIISDIFSDINRSHRPLESSCAVFQTARYSVRIRMKANHGILEAVYRSILRSWTRTGESRCQRLRSDGCGAVCRKQDGGFHVGSHAATSDQPENVQTHNRPWEIFHSVGIFLSNFVRVELVARGHSPSSGLENTGQRLNVNSNERREIHKKCDLQENSRWPLNYTICNRTIRRCILVNYCNLKFSSMNAWKFVVRL